MVVEVSNDLDYRTVPRVPIGAVESGYITRRRAIYLMDSLKMNQRIGYNQKLPTRIGTRPDVLD